MRVTKLAITFVAAVLLCGSTASADQFDITTLPGYGVVTSGTFNFRCRGLGWMVGAYMVRSCWVRSIISAGDSISDFSVFRPAGPGETTPFGYTYGANEYGFVIQDNGLGANNGVQIELYYADPLAGYTITKSCQLNYSCYRVGWMVCSDWPSRERRWLPVLDTLVHIRPVSEFADWRVQCGRITRSEPMSRDGSFRVAR